MNMEGLNILSLFLKDRYSLFIKITITARVMSTYSFYNIAAIQVFKFLVSACLECLRTKMREAILMEGVLRL